MLQRTRTSTRLETPSRWNRSHRPSRHRYLGLGLEKLEDRRLLAVLAPGDTIDRLGGWTGNSTIEENWGYFYARDNDGNPRDGYQASGTPMQFDPDFYGQRFAVSDNTSPTVSRPGLGVNPFFVPAVPVNEWWSIARWTSEQDGLNLQATGSVGFSANTIVTGQAVVAIRQGTVWTELVNVDHDGSDSWIGASTFAPSSFELNTGDEIVVALRKVANAKDGFVFFVDSQLEFVFNSSPSLENQTIAVDEGVPQGTVLGTVAASDPDTGDALSFAITGGMNRNYFDIDQDNGQITLIRGPLDFEAKPSYDLEVQVTDTHGLTDTATVSINLNNVNEAPIIGEIARIAGWTGTSLIEENWSYSYAHDTDGDPSDGYQASGTPMQFDPDFFGQRFAVGDNTSPTVSRPGLGVNSFFVPAVPVNEWWAIARWTSEQDGLNLQATGSVGFSANTIATGQAVVAIRQSGQWTELLNEVGTAGDAYRPDTDFSTRKFTLNEADELVIALRKTTNNGGFVFLTDAHLRFYEVFDVDENSPNGATLGTVRAVDVDAGDDLTYSIIGGSGSSAFAIDPDTGEVTVADSGQLDFESSSSFTLTVQVADAGGLTDSATIPIDVNDVNEAPVLRNPLDDIEVNQGDLDRVIDLSDVFEDLDAGDGLTLTVSGNSNSSILTASVVASSLTLDFLPDQHGTADVIVRATDGSGLIAEDTFQVKILSPQDQLDELIDDVANVGLPEGQTNALTSVLDNAIQSLDDGNLNSGVNKIQAFINHVNALVSSGELTQAEADNLIDLGNAAIASALPGLRAAEQVVSSAASRTLPGAPAVSAAIDLVVTQWQAAGAAADDLGRIRSIDVYVADLPNTYLGVASADTIWIDVDAAGFGWSLDTGVVPDRMHLLSAVAHELGHVMGLEHDRHHADTLMSDQLTVGQTLLPPRAFEPRGRQGAFSQSHLWSAEHAIAGVGGDLRLYTPSWRHANLVDSILTSRATSEFENTGRVHSAAVSLLNELPVQATMVDWRLYGRRLSVAAEGRLLDEHQQGWHERAAEALRELGMLE